MSTADPEPLEAAIAALRRAPRATVLRVLDLLEGLDAYGPDPSAEAISEAHAWTDRIGAEQRRALIAESFTRDEAARLVGVTPQAVSDKLGRGEPLGVKEGREWRLPKWQFDLDGVLPGLHEVGAAFPGGVVALSRWMARENADLGGLTPRAAIIRGQSRDVLRLIRAL
jgi:hypothetical protein